MYGRNEDMEPEFNSNCDSFFLILKNLNYQDKKAAISISSKTVMLGLSGIDSP